MESLGKAVGLILLSVIAGALLYAGQRLLTPEEFVVNAGAVRYFNFAVLSGTAQVSGGFHTTGGAKNDIRAIVATTSECENWINGNRANTFYATNGAVTNGQINLNLSPGRYCVAFSNRDSLISAKEVHASISFDGVGGIEKRRVR